MKNWDAGYFGGDSDNSGIGEDCHRGMLCNNDECATSLIKNRNTPYLKYHDNDDNGIDGNNDNDSDNVAGWF